MKFNALFLAQFGDC